MTTKFDSLKTQADFYITNCIRIDKHYKVACNDLKNWLPERYTCYNGEYEFNGFIVELDKVDYIDGFDILWDKALFK